MKSFEDLTPKLAKYFAKFTADLTAASTQLSDGLNNLTEVVTKSVAANVRETLNENTRETLILTGFTLWKIPLIAFLSPKVVRFDNERIEIEIPLGYRSKNHIGSMYFGALATGADLAMGYLVFREMHRAGLNAQFVFKSFQGEFLRRADADVTFVCTQVQKLKDFVKDCATSPERITRRFEVTALTRSTSGEEPVAEFSLELSMKKRA